MQFTDPPFVDPTKGGADNQEFFPIEFHVEDVQFDLSNLTVYTDWIEQIIQREEHQLVQLNYIFCSDQYLHSINVEYLDHDTYTDIITFPYTERPYIEGDIFISIDRVKENAEHLNVSFEQELQRVIIHGVLHLCGYPDKTPEQAKQMREKENESIQLLATLR